MINQHMRRHVLHKSACEHLHCNDGLQEGQQRLPEHQGSMDAMTLPFNGTTAIGHSGAQIDECHDFCGGRLVILYWNLSCITATTRQIGRQPQHDGRRRYSPQPGLWWGAAAALVGAILFGAA